jgi:ABC-2 type transport system permease protein
VIFTIAWREFRNLFLSPLAWCVLAVVQVIHGWLFAASLDYFLRMAPAMAQSPNARGATEAVGTGLFSVASFIMLLVVPLVSMRLVAEERRNGTLGLLISAPLSMTEIVVGKYLGLLAFLFLMVFLTALMPLSLGLGTHLDYGRLLAGVLGLTLLLGAFAAAGLYMSTLTRQPVVAAVSSFGLLLFLWIINWLAKGDDRFSGALHYLSLIDHYDALLRGAFNSSDVIYYLLFIVTFLVFSVRRLDSYRLQH